MNRMKKRIASILLATAFLLISTVSNVFAGSGDITLNSISDKNPGDSVTISGSSSLGEISIKIIAPNNTVLYFGIEKDTGFSQTIRLPADAQTGVYTVVAGRGTTTATTVFTVKTQGTAVPVTGVMLNTNSLSLYIGDSGQLYATVVPADASNQNVTWESSNNNIAAVDGTGKVTAVAAGTAAITAVTADGGKTAACTVTVIARSGSGSSGSGGSGTTQPTAPGADNGTITPNAVLNPATGYAEVKISAGDVVKAAETAVAGADGVRTIVVKVAKVEGAKGIAVAFIKNMLDKASLTQYIRVETELGTLRIPDTMLSNLDAAANATVQVEIAQADKSGLPEDIQAAIGDKPVVDLSLRVNGSTVAWSNESEPVTISMPYTPTAAELADPEHITVWYIDGAGNPAAVPTGRYDPSTGKVTFKTTHFSKYAAVFVKKTFNDIAGYAWAKKQIEVMASKGVINGTSADSFTPGSEIKRADFMLLLVKALGLSAKKDGNFADVSSNAYYADALATAKKLGIATGVGDNRFNPEAKISRQDMMTLIDRAMKAAKKEMTAGSSSDLSRYDDKSNVADYAAQSVSTLIRNGIVTGDGSNINPLGNATRAETAVLIYRIYNK